MFSFDRRKEETTKISESYCEPLDFVSKYRRYCKKNIYGERTANFEIHLQSVEHMLPFFASSGHRYYAKCARIYLQQMRK